MDQDLKTRLASALDGLNDRYSEEYSREMSLRDGVSALIQYVLAKEETEEKK